MSVKTDVKKSLALTFKAMKQKPLMSIITVLYWAFHVLVVKRRGYKGLMAFYAIEAFTSLAMVLGYALGKNFEKEIESKMQRINKANQDLKKPQKSMANVGQGLGSLIDDTISDGWAKKWHDMIDSEMTIHVDEHYVQLIKDGDNVVIWHTRFDNKPYVEMMVKRARHSLPLSNKWRFVMTKAKTEAMQRLS